MDDDDRLAAAKRTVAAQHLGDPAAGEWLRGGNVVQLRASAEQPRRAAGLPDDGSRPSLSAAIYVTRQRQRERLRRFFGR